MVLEDYFNEQRIVIFNDSVESGCTTFPTISSGHNPNAAAISAVQDLISYGVAIGKIDANYTLLGHRQTASTDCPGDSLYQLIQTWPRWSSTG